ncbi:MAG TPA: phosphate signaling complex protein PhoU [Polyangiales bacterium]|nr:phosphate signaling complex protein PhoU [Polyangiales bacterium]
MTRAHTDREYEGQLDELRERLLRMAGVVEQMIVDAVRASLEQDRALAEATIARDPTVNRLEVESDELCLLILARRQPMASDLRFVTLSLKMVTDLERIGDLAVNICERAIELAGHPQPWPWDTIEDMARVVRAMIRDSIQAFVDRDVDKAQRVIARDEEVDQLYWQVFRVALEIMRRQPGTMHDGIHVQSVAKFLERMGDHGTNLAEQVVFMVKGKDIRHMGKVSKLVAS